MPVEWTNQRTNEPTNKRMKEWKNVVSALDFSSVGLFLSDKTFVYFANRPNSIDKLEFKIVCGIYKWQSLKRFSAHSTDLTEPPLQIRYKSKTLFKNCCAKLFMLSFLFVSFFSRFRLVFVFPFNCCCLFLLLGFWNLCRNLCVFFVILFVLLLFMCVDVLIKSKMGAIYNVGKKKES